MDCCTRAGAPSIDVRNNMTCIVMVRFNIAEYVRVCVSVSEVGATHDLGTTTIHTARILSYEAEA